MTIKPSSGHLSLFSPVDDPRKYNFAEGLQSRREKILLKKKKNNPKMSSEKTKGTIITNKLSVSYKYNFYIVLLADAR